MKLSELQHGIDKLRNVCQGDPTVEFEMGGSKVMLTDMIMILGTSDFSKRGELLPLPKHDETMLIQLEGTDG